MPAESHPDLAALLRRLRVARNLSQEELAAKAGVSAASVSYLERGLTHAPHRDTLQLLTNALVLTPDEASEFIRAGRRHRGAILASGSAGSATRNPPPSGESQSPALPPYRLIAPLTPLLGRATEETVVTRLLSRESVRLLTLTGPAGVGKTRMALKVAVTVREQSGFEPLFVDLVAVHQADRVLTALALALGIRDVGSQPLFDAVIAAIGDRRLLLVLDNYEHVLASAPLCAAVLGACPNSKALVTSRAKLNIRGEYEFEVLPLPIPDLDTLPALTALQRFGAVELFIERARAVKADFELASEEQGRLAATICARLDGLPLAIELAAAQIKNFSLDALSTRLQGVTTLDLLTGGPHDLADHQRAMRSTIAWSYDRLPLHVQRVFSVLGAFAGGATVDALVTVADLNEEIVREGLESLTGANLVRLILDQDTRRYDQLVIVRAFAQDRLRASGELAMTQRHLADYIASLVEIARPNANDAHTTQLNRLIPEHENIGVVLDWILENGEILFGMRLCIGLRYFWERRGFALEGVTWTERFLDRAAPPRTAVEREIHENAWSASLVLNHRLSRYELAVKAGEQALALAREGGNATKLATAMNGLANPLLNLGDLDRAEDLYNESLAIYRAEGDRAAEETSLLNLGELRNAQGRHDEALAYQIESLAISHSRGEQEAARALLLSNTGETYIMLDRPSEALEILLESRRLFEELNEPPVLALYNLGRATWRMGRWDEALDHLEQASAFSRRQDDVAMLVQELCVIAGIALEKETLDVALRTLDEVNAMLSRVSDKRIQWRLVERAAGYACRQGAFGNALRLYAAVARGRDATHDLVDPSERQLRARDQATALKALGKRVRVEADSAWVGENLLLQQAVELARAALAIGNPNAKS